MRICSVCFQYKRNLFLQKAEGKGDSYNLAKIHIYSLAVTYEASELPWWRIDF